MDVAYTLDAEISLLRKMLKDNGILHPRRHNRVTLHRFLSANGNNVEKSFQMLKADEEWRVQRDVDNLCASFQFPQLSILKKNVPRCYHGVDKEGRPIYIERYSDLVPEELNQIPQDKMMEFFIVDLEKHINFRLPACTLAKGQTVHHGLYILDLKDVSILTLKKIFDLAMSASKVSKEHYPETLGKMLVINAPTMISIMMAAVKPFLDQGTYNKIEVYRPSVSKEALLKYVDDDQIPEIIGGKCKCPGGCFESEKGPWSTINFQEVEEYFENRRKSLFCNL